METGIYSNADSLMESYIRQKLAIKEKLNRNIPDGKREKLEYRLKVLNQKIKENNNSYFL
jgi:hypothetical protein